MQSNLKFFKWLTDLTTISISFGQQIFSLRIGLTINSLLRVCFKSVCCGQTKSWNLSNLKFTVMSLIYINTIYNIYNIFFTTDFLLRWYCDTYLFSLFRCKEYHAGRRNPDRDWESSHAKQTLVRSHMLWYIASKRLLLEILVRNYHFDKISVVLNFPSNL